AVSHAFAAFERQDFRAAIDALKPITGELERIGGSRAQLDLVEFTLLRAYIGAGRLDNARRMLSTRRRGSSRLPVAGLAAVHRCATASICPLAARPRRAPPLPLRH